jgi:ribosomal protein S6--L-glutamate ligase
VKEAGGRDVRVLVVGGRVVAAMERRAAAGDFRANMHQGGSAVKIKLTPQEKRVALAAAKAVGLSVAGVDLLRGENGPLVLEVNSSPGLEGIEGTTKIDVAGKILEFAEKLANGSAQHPSPRTRKVS